MDEEVGQLKQLMTERVIVTASSMEFCRGRIYGREVVVVRSGVGKVNAGIAAALLCNLFHANYIINTGIAGSLDAQIDIGDIVLSTDAVQHDFDATTFGKYEPGEIPRLNVKRFQADKTLIDLAEKAGAEFEHLHIHKGTVVTGDQFISDNKRKEWIKNEFDGLCTEMEGAAIAQGAYLSNVPFLIIRAISDKADNSAVTDYPEFEKHAIKNSVTLVKNLIQTIPQ